MRPVEPEEHGRKATRTPLSRSQTVRLVLYFLIAYPLGISLVVAVLGRLVGSPELATAGDNPAVMFGGSFVWTYFTLAKWHRKLNPPPPPLPPPPAPPEPWTATHLIPEGGLVARDVPNADAPELFRSQALVEVQVVETKGVWARIRTEENWTGWVDARRLVEMRGA